MTVLHATIPASITAVEAVPADAARTSLAFVNIDPNRVYFLVGEVADVGVVSPSNFSDYMTENGSVVFSGPDIKARVAVIWVANGGGSLQVTKSTDAYQGTSSQIQNFGQLKSTMTDWLRPNATPSTDMVTQVPKYISLFEVEANRLLSNDESDSIDTAYAITSGFADVPDGLVKVKSMRNAAYPYSPITEMPSDVMEQQDPTRTDGPYNYCRVGSQFMFWPPISGTARLLYRRGLVPLSADGDANWLLAKHPDAYLYGALRHADARLIGVRLPQWEAKFTAAMAEIIAIKTSMQAGGLRPQPSGNVA